jgi:hypothetical protein
MNSLLPSIAELQLLIPYPVTRSQTNESFGHLSSPNDPRNTLLASSKTPLTEYLPVEQYEQDLSYFCSLPLEKDPRSSSADREKCSSRSECGNVNPLSIDFDTVPSFRELPYIIHTLERKLHGILDSTKQTEVTSNVLGPEFQSPIMYTSNHIRTLFLTVSNTCHSFDYHTRSGLEMPQSHPRSTWVQGAETYLWCLSGV